MTSVSEARPATARPPALLGQRVVLTGRFATMSREEAERHIEDAGGYIAASTTPRTRVLVVGMRGWPLMDEGRLPRNLAEAERLAASGKPIRVVTETEFRRMLGLSLATETAKSLAAAHVCAALGIDAATLTRWERCGLVESRDGLYDFRDIVSLRTVTELVARGVSPQVIRESLASLSRFLPGVDRPLAQLSIIQSGAGDLVAQLEDALLTPSGQFEMRFEEAGRVASEQEVRPLALTRPAEEDCESLLAEGLRLEEAGDLERAERAYRRATELAPGDATAHFNLGNVLLAGDRLEAAAERFAQAVALDPEHARAWFNLAYVRDEMRDSTAALRHLRKAIAADRGYADAYFNLADVAERLGEIEAAAKAWDAYLRLDPVGEWAEQARRRRDALRSRAWG